MVPGALSLGVKRQEHEAELQLMPMSKRMEILYFLSVFKAWCLINYAQKQLHIYLKINVKETDWLWNAFSWFGLQFNGGRL
jgi:hypothetical protein